MTMPLPEVPQDFPVLEPVLLSRRVQTVGAINTTEADAFAGEKRTAHMLVTIHGEAQGMNGAAMGVTVAISLADVDTVIAQLTATAHRIRVAIGEA